MKILPISLIHIKNKNIQTNTFKSKTIVYPEKVVEEDILTIKDEKSILSNPINIKQNFLGVNLSKVDDKTLAIKSRYGNQTGVIKYNKNAEQPIINVQMGDFQPVIEIKDEELGITVLLTRGSNLEGKNLSVNYNGFNSSNVSFGSNRLLIASDYKSDLTEGNVQSYYDETKNLDIRKSVYSKKLKNEYTIIGLTGSDGNALKSISDIQNGNKDTIKLPNSDRTLLDVSILDTTSRLGNINDVEYYANEEETKVGTGGIIIKALQEGKISMNKPLVVMSGGHVNNIDLARVLYEYEQDSSPIGIAMVVHKVDNDDLIGKAPIQFDSDNKVTNLYNQITKETSPIDINKQKMNGEIYASSNITIINPQVLPILKNFSDENGNADFVEFLGLMFNVMNKQNENLRYKYPDDIKSKELKINDLTDEKGYPQKIKSLKGGDLSFKVIKSQDIDGDSAKSYNVGTIEDYINVAKKIKAKNFEGLPAPLIKAVRDSVDNNGVIYNSEDAREKFKLLKKKYGIDNISGNAIVYSTPTKGKNNNSQGQKVRSERSIYELTKDKNVSRELVKNLATGNANVMKNLIDAYGLKNVVKWYCDIQGYYGEYEKYMDDLYSEAKSIDELLKHQPNWTPWKLEEKAWLLDNASKKMSTEEKLKEFYLYSDVEREYPFKIGELPCEFSNIVEYQDLVQRLKTQNIQEMSVKINNQNCKVKKLKGGDLNDKFIYTLTFADKKYILKFDRTNIEDAKKIDDRELSNYEKRTIRKNKYLSADSIYIDSCVNRYLELNGCKSVPHLYLYDHTTHSSLYEFIEDKNSDMFQNDLMDEEYVSIDEMNAKYDDLSKYGVYLNDTALKNSLIDKSGKEIIIDLGHCSFIQPFKPGVKRYNIDLPNINGPDINNIYASILMAMNS